MSNNGGLKRHIPNTLTLLNLFCGTLALFFISQGDWGTVFILMIIAGVADLLDGLVARALNVSTPIGGQLDSLADMVSFGVVPGMILFNMLLSFQINADFKDTSLTPYIISACPALLFPICAALRLARFNVEDDSSGDFRGLSTPSATATVVGFMLLFAPALEGGWTAYPPLSFLSDGNTSVLTNCIYTLSVILPLLMISNITMFSLKFKGKGWKGNELRYIFIPLFFIILFIQPKAAILAIMVLYILTNVILHFYRKLTT